MTRKVTIYTVEVKISDSETRYLGYYTCTAQPKKTALDQIARMGEASIAQGQIKGYTINTDPGYLSNNCVIPYAQGISTPPYSSIREL